MQCSGKCVASGILKRDKCTVWLALPFVCGEFESPRSHFVHSVLRSVRSNIHLVVRPLCTYRRWGESRCGEMCTLRCLREDLWRVKEDSTGAYPRYDIPDVRSRVRSVIAALTPILPASFFLLPRVLGGPDVELQLLAFFVASLLAFSTGTGRMDWMIIRK